MAELMAWHTSCSLYWYLTETRDTAMPRHDITGTCESVPEQESMMKTLLPGCVAVLGICVVLTAAAQERTMPAFVDVTETWLKDGTEKAMNAFNRGADGASNQ